MIIHRTAGVTYITSTLTKGLFAAYKEMFAIIANGYITRTGTSNKLLNDIKRKI